jgi:hypothetical protein
VHVGIKGWRDSEAYKRDFLEALCDRGEQDRLNSAWSQCVAGGNPCWQRDVEVEDQATAAATPPLALPEAFDHLDAIWRLAFGRRQALVHVQSLEGVGELTQPCVSKDEFAARMTKLADLIKLLEIPDRLLPSSASDEDRNGSLNRLNAALRGSLGAIEYERAARGIAVLRAVNEVRVCLQHTAKDRDLPQALARLGIGSFPPVWSEAWDHIRARTVAALAMIRDEVRTLAPL